jgi:hypothetical protein
MPLSAQQMCVQACQVAKCPGYLTQAGQYLNAILVQHALDYDLDIIRRTTTITTTTGTPSYSLPANYLRAREVFYNINGEVFWLDPKTLAQYDQLFQGPGEIDYPYLYATDIAQAPPLMYFYPAPIATLSVTVRYMDNLVEITSPSTSSTVPYLQDQIYLMDRIALELMKITDDERIPLWQKMVDNADLSWMKMANDQNGRVLKVGRDPDSFRAVGRLKPTKLQGS